MDAASLLREARTRAGLSQRELARRARTSQSAVARYERGSATPAIPSLQRILRACGFELRAQLVPHDEDLDALIDMMLRMSVEDRLRTAANYAKLVRQLRDE